MAGTYKGGTFKFDASRFMEASQKLLSLTKKQTPQEVLKKHMAQFVRNVINITPPAMGSADASAKARGENALLADLLRLAQPVSVDGRRRRGLELVTPEEFREIHARAVSAQTGRVNPRGRKEQVLIAQRDFDRVFRALAAEVGKLAAGWNAALAQLGGSGAPAWIARHGARHGRVQISITDTSVKISVINDVPFADHVKGFSARVQSALNFTASQLEKGYEQALTRASRSAGFR